MMETSIYINSLPSPILTTSPKFNRTYYMRLNTKIMNFLIDNLYMLPFKTFLDPNIHLRILSSNILNLLSALEGYISQSYVITGIIISFCKIMQNLNRAWKCSIEQFNVLNLGSEKLAWVDLLVHVSVILRSSIIALHMIISLDYLHWKFV